MEPLLSTTDFEFLKSFLSEAARSDLAEYLIVVFIVWKVVVNKVAFHFKNLEHSVDSINETLRDGFERFGSRLKIVEDRVDDHDRQLKVINKEDVRGTH